jgi:DNA-nicking Smr family endonuclease
MTGHLIFHQNDLPHKQLKAFKTGQYVIEASLDLHGYTQQPAYRAIQSFLTQAFQRRWSIVCIITGKGDCMRHLTLQLLRHDGRILACANAPYYLGGAGALLTWLRSNTLCKQFK